MARRMVHLLSTLLLVVATSACRSPAPSRFYTLDATAVSDGTPQAVDRAAASFPGVVRVLTQPNRGRFLARWEGITNAAADLVLLLDSRVLVHRGAIRHVLQEIGATRPLAVVRREKVAELREWAESRTVPAD